MPRSMSLALCSAALMCAAPLFAGCGSAPPPPPPKPKAANKTLVPTPRPIRAPAPEKRYVVLFDGALPDEETIEKGLALGNYVAEVGESSAGIEIALPGTLCTIAETTRPEDVPRHFLPSDIKPHELSDDEAKALFETKKAASVVCEREDRDLPARNMMPFAEAAVTSLAAGTNGWIADTQTGRYWPKDAWAQSREANKTFSAERHIRVVRDRDPDTGVVWLGTRGLIAFGKPDLEAFPVDGARADAVAGQLRSMGDLLIEEPEVADGMVLSLGPVDALLIERDTFAGTLPTGTVGVGMKTPGPSLGRLAVADPEAPQGDLKKHGSFLRRLTVR